MEIYPPSEDSLLLSRFVEEELKEKNNLKILDMGSGSGIQAGTAIKHGISPENITLADINSDAVKLLKKKFPKSKVLLSDLFSKIPANEKFDLIIFNPPYLPEDKFDIMHDTSGGKSGSETINKFLKKAKSYLNKNSIILLLTSSLTKNINWDNYSKELLGKKKLFFEELYAWKLFLK
jgi:release factor glutamine methyltransferase